VEVQIYVMVPEVYIAFILWCIEVGASCLRSNGGIAYE